MTRHTPTPAFIDTARPLPFQMRHARWLEGEGDGGNGGEGGENSGQGGAGDQSSTGSTGEAGNGGQSGTGESSGSEAQNVDELPDWAQKIIRDTRAEAANHRTKANEATQAQQATLDGIAKALGLKTDEGGQTPTVESLTEQLTAEKQTTTQAQAEARAARVELATFRAAGKHDADAAALLDSRSFLAKVETLDPSKDDFTSQLDAAIKKAVEDNPKLKASQAGAHRSGQDFTGGTGEGRVRTPKSLDEAVATRYRS